MALKLLRLALAVWLCARGTSSLLAADLAMTGALPAGMQSYDRLLTEFMAKWNLPGGVVAVAKEGRLVLSRGYGLADVEKNEPVEPDAMFRLASVSKPITAVAILRLVDQERLDLDAAITTLLDKIEPPPGKDKSAIDPRWSKITLRHVLQHTGGWDSGRSFDPMFRPKLIADALGTPPPADARSVLRYMLGQPLDFDPGQRYAYSNFGYCVLGRVIERATGRKYDDAVRQLVLEPCGMNMTHLGRTLPSGRLKGEVVYYDQPATQLAANVLGGGEQVPWPYGGFYLEAMDAHGGWAGSATDLIRLATHLEGTRKPRLLSDRALAQMTARPAPPVSAGESFYYGLGWDFRPTSATDANWWHMGSLPGTTTILVRTSRGLTWAALFNSRPASGQNKFHQELDRLMWQAATEVTEWPKHDLLAR